MSHYAMYSKRFTRKLFALIFSAACILATVSGCSTPKTAAPAGTLDTASTGSTSTEAPAAKTPTNDKPKISIMIPLYYSEAPTAGGDIEKRLEEFGGVDLEFLFVPINSYTEKLNLAITSNELPTAVSVLEIKSPVFVNSVRGDMFWGINDRMDQLPALSANYDAQTLKNASIDNTLYGLPRGRPLTRDGIIYRKDWAENLNLTIQQPATLDDIYGIIKAFATQDPDGNGKNDTSGMLVGVDEFGKMIGYLMETLDIMNGGGNGWVEQDGQLVPTFMTDARLQSLNFMKKLYDEGLINQDFANLKPSQFYEALDKEQAGFFFQTLTDAHERLDNIVKVVQARDPELAKLTPVNAKTEIFDTIYQLQAENGEIRACTEPGFNGLIAFPKSSNKTEQDLMNVLNFFDKMDTPEGQSIIYWGIEGKHYTMDDSGKAVMTEDSLLFSREVQPYWQIFCTNRVVDRSSIKGYVAPMYEKVYGEMASLAPYAVYNPIVPLVSDTYSTNGASMDKIFYDAQTKYIMGIIDEAGLESAIEQWKKAGGEKVIAEYTQAHNMNK